MSKLAKMVYIWFYIKVSVLDVVKLAVGIFIKELF